MLVPAALTARMLRKISCTTMGARPSEGSSMHSRRGSDMRARDSASICCSPPESVPAGCAARSRRRGKPSIARSIRASTFLRSLRYLKPPISRFSRTLSAGNTRRPSGTRAMPAAARWCAGMRVTSLPSNTILPRRGSMAPATPRMVVLLPAPLAPIRVTISPSATSNDTARTAGTSPYASSRFSTLSSKLAPEVGRDHLRVRLHLARRAFEQRHAVVHDEHALGDVHDEVHVVLDHHHRDASLVDGFEPFQKKVDFGAVQPRRRLVQHEKLRPRGERARDLEHALLAVGKRAGPVARAIGQAHERKQLERLAAEASDAAGQEALPQRHVLMDMEAGEHVLEQRELLEQADLLEGAGEAESHALMGSQANQITIVK